MSLNESLKRIDKAGQKYHAGHSLYGKEGFKRNKAHNNPKAKALKKHKEGVGKGTGVPKEKWGARQGNWHKVMPGDR